MVNRFLRLKKPISKAVIDLEIDHLFDETLVQQAEALKMALEPLSMAVLALSRQDATLLSAEGVLKFLFKELEKANSEIGRKLLDSLKLELGKRRNKILTSLIKFLQNPQINNDEDDFFEQASLHQIIKFAKKEFERLFPNTTMTASEVDDQIPLLPSDSESGSLKERLEGSINDMFSKASPKPNSSSLLAKEFKLAQATGELTPNLIKLYDALKTIKPTSTDSERAFSDAVNFVTKRRCSLGDSSIDALCFLKAYFKKNLQ